MRNSIQKRSRKNKYIAGLPLLALCLPVIIYFIMFHYLPIFGIVIAFKDFNYIDGILGSPWVGLDNFKFFFMSNDALRVIGNTVGYSLWFNLLSIVASITVAILLYEVNSKKCLKYFQTTMAIPSMISWVIVAYIVYSVFNYESGVANTLVANFGLDKIKWYSEPEYWPWILSFVRIWQGIGMSCVLYYAALMGIDESLFEAAKLDGANRLKQIWHISLPAITPVICVMAILSMADIMSGNIGIFYQVPRDSVTLYPVTDIINTYILRGLKTGSIGVSSAVGLFQNIAGCIMLIATNTLVKKINPENAMF